MGGSKENQNHLGSLMPSSNLQGEQHWDLGRKKKDLYWLYQATFISWIRDWFFATLYFGVFNKEGGSRMEGVKIMKEMTLNNRRALSNINQNIMEATHKPCLVNRTDPFGQVLLFLLRRNSENLVFCWYFISLSFFVNSFFPPALSNTIEKNWNLFMKVQSKCLLIPWLMGFLLVFFPFRRYTEQTVQHCPEVLSL